MTRTSRTLQGEQKKKKEDEEMCQGTDKQKETKAHQGMK